jgi:catechol 2,3-dioxygenase-like lactoylglutathione lyase family enzyme
MPTAPIPAVLQHVHPVLMSSDVAASLRFYGRLGFATLLVDAPARPRYAVIARDRVQLHLQWNEVTGWPAGVDRPVTRFVVDDVDRLSAELAALGPDIERTEVGDTAWGTREFHVRDPDGNGLQFYRLR